MYTTFSHDELDAIRAMAAKENISVQRAYSRVWRRRKRQPDMPAEQLFSADGAERTSAFGRRMHLQEWASAFGMSTSALTARIEAFDSLEEALLWPRSAIRVATGAQYEWEGELLSLREIAARRGLRYVSLRQAISRYQKANPQASVDEALAAVKIKPLRDIVREADGREQPLSVWAKEIGLTQTELVERLDGHDSLETILSDRRPHTFQGVSAPMEVWRYWLDSPELRQDNVRLWNHTAKIRAQSLGLEGDWIATLGTAFGDLRSTEPSDQAAAMEALRWTLHQHMTLGEKFDESQ